MNKKIIIVIISVIILIGINTLGKSELTVSNNPKNISSTNNTETRNTQNTTQHADRIEVVNFFGTQRCMACITLGKFTKKTIEKKFAEELESGRVVFKEINGELPENRETVIKYQARGSSLYINAISDDKDNITEEVTVWRLLNNEDQFSAYLEKKLLSLLGT